MYEIDGKDTVIMLDKLPQSSIGAPCPVVVAGEHDVLLSYYLEKNDKNWNGTNIRIVGTDSEEDSLAIVKFEKCYSHMFGPPNDEAFSGHPLTSKGLKPYSVFEVENSSWIRKYEKMNSVHPYHKKEEFMNEKRHFIFSFHDSVFECIANDFKVEIRGISIRKAMEIMVKEIR